jgi:hypothetical protein
MGSIYSEVPGSVEEQHFNVGLFSLHNGMLIILKKLIQLNNTISGLQTLRLPKP